MDIQLSLERGLFDLLARIAEDYALDYEELCDRYMSAQAPEKPTRSRSSRAPPRTSSPPKACQGKTAKGQPCKKKACAGGDFCKTHEPKEDSEGDETSEDLAPKLCRGKTAKGQPCKKKACADSDFCKTHEPLSTEDEEQASGDDLAPKLCRGVTGKKKPCKKKACAGGDYCAAHSGTGDGPFKLPSAASTAKAAIHSHDPGETSEDCDACSQYGDPVNSPAARRDYRIVTRSVSKKVEEEEDEEDMTEFAEKLQRELEAQGLLEEDD